MRPIAPRTGAPEATIAEEQEEYQPITVAVYELDHGRVYLARYTFTDAERAAIAAGEDVYFGQLTFNGKMTPIVATVGQAEWQR